MVETNVSSEQSQGGEFAWMAEREAQMGSSTEVVTFKAEERATLNAKIERRLQAAESDAVVVVGPGNFTYVTGIALPFAEQYPGRPAVAIRTVDGAGGIVCPPDWAEAIRAQGWDGQLRPYAERETNATSAMLVALEELLTDLRLTHSKVSLDMRFASHALVQQLTHHLSAVKWTPGDEMLRRLRQVKTEAEIRLLERAARQSDRAVISALNHMEGTIDVLSYTVTEFTERLRVHVGEFGGSSAGHIATMQGADAQVYYLPPHGSFREGNLVRVELTNHHRGYWADATRTIVIGEPTEAQAQAYRDNIRLKKAALDALRPGNTCQAVFDATIQFAQAEGIEFWQAAGVGHGVGTSEREAPYLTAGDPTTLAPGMVLVLAIYTYGPRRELICSKDTYAIVEDGHRRLSWYRDWDALYRVLGHTARHG